MTVETGVAVLEETLAVESTQCDACGTARAAWKIVSSSGAFLLMCGHHKTVHEPGLSTWATEMLELDSKT